MLINGERAMAYVVKIDDIQAIEGADRIELVKVGGWNVVAQKGLYQINDLAVYCEIDSWIPHSVAPFLTQDGHYPKVYNEVEGQRLKTKKLKGVFSQGLLLPLSEIGVHDDITGKYIMVYDEDLGEYSVTIEEGLDMTSFLGIQKWEKPLSPELHGMARGNFPSFIPKTDEERVQNLTKVLPKYIGMSFEVTEKLHGSSMTVYIQEHCEELLYGVCSRNIDLKESDTNTYWKTAKEQGLLNILEKMYMSTDMYYALQGELIGEGINGNMYGIKGHQFRLFNIFNITEGRYLTPIERTNMWNMVCREGDMHVPIISQNFILSELYDCEQLLKMVSILKSDINKKVWAEGWVLKCNETDFSFKVISNKFLTSNEGEDA